MRDSLSTLLDTFFLFAISFLIFLTGLRFYCPVSLTLILAALLGGVCAFLFYLWRHKRYGALQLSKREAVYLTRCLRALSQMPYADAEGFLKELYERKEGCLLSPKRGNGKTFYFGDNGKIYAFFPEYFPLKAERLSEVLRNNPSLRPVNIVACGFEDSALAVSKAFGASSLGAKDLCADMKEQNLYPPLSEGEGQIKKPLRVRLRELLSRKRSRRFFALGAWMTVFSLFIPFPTYYLISGGIFLFLSAFCLLFGVKA